MEQFKEFHKELERLKTSGFSTGEIKKVCQNSVKDIIYCSVLIDTHFFKILTFRG